MKTVACFGTVGKINMNRSQFAETPLPEQHERIGDVCGKNHPSGFGVTHSGGDAFSWIAPRMAGAPTRILERAPVRNDPHLASLAHDVRQPRGTFPALRVEQVARRVFLETVSVFSADDTVIAERGLRDVSIVYTSAGASASSWDLTRIALRLHVEVGEMWIGSLRVAVSFRSKGLGTRLVVAAERIARAARIEVIHVLPLLTARSFWRRNGYRHQVCTARVVSKYMSPRADGRVVDRSSSRIRQGCAVTSRR